ncbi:MAG: hypothetical protein C0484_22735 [Rhodospirillum sp.]|jgi:hypothetical protein|nr:hypothetical protein [Rhodospirillum sp.]
MRLRYVFRDVDETLLATVETDQPIAHLAIGTNIVLQTDKYAPERETWLRVEHIMVGVTTGVSGITQDKVGLICSVQSTKSTTVAQGHTPNSYQDMVETLTETR